MQVVLFGNVGNNQGHQKLHGLFMLEVLLQTMATLFKSLPPLRSARNLAKTMLAACIACWPKGETLRHLCNFRSADLKNSMCAFRGAFAVVHGSLEESADRERLLGKIRAHDIHALQNKQKELQSLRSGVDSEDVHDAQK